MSAVFQEQGFAVMSRNSNSITFTKPGGRTADVTWSTLGNPNPVMIRPTVSWQSAGSGQMLVACQVQVAQQSTTFGETVRQPALIGKFAYDGMLRDAKRRVEGGR